MSWNRTLRYILLFIALGIAPACERVKSVNPLSPDIAGPIPGVSISAPTPMEPAQGQQVIYDGSPMTLLIQNASTSGQREVWMQIELAADAGFAQMLHHADRVTPGPNGRTSYRLPEPLGPGHTYYWRARALDGANTSPYSGTYQFTLVEEVIIEPPTPLEPNGTLTTNRPEFRARNGRVTGPAGNVVYRFEIGLTPDLNSPTAVVTTTPHPSGTTTMSVGDLPYATNFFWRAYASDGIHESPRSGTIAFRTPNAPAPPPPPTPTPTPGGGGNPLPGGSGGRTPDPAPGQRLPLPNMFHVVQQVANARPDLLRYSCQEHGESWAFMDLVVDTLRTYDTRWGYNWKRGNVGDPSMDVIDYHWGRGPDEGSTEVYIIDIIGGHCGSNPQPVWNDVTGATAAGGAIGRWTGRGRF